MQFTIATTLLFAAAALAKIHTFCQCSVNGADNQALDIAACDDWSGIYPNSHWDTNPKACVDYHKHGGIEGQPWEDTCQKIGVKAPFNLPIGAIRGNCWS